MRMGRLKSLPVQDGWNWNLQNIREGRPLLPFGAEDAALMMINQQRKQDRQAEATAARAVVHGPAAQAMGLVGPMVPPAAASAFVDLTGDVEMDVHQIYIPGRPIPKPSAKWGPGRGSKGHWYQPGSNVKNKIRDAILDKLPQSRHGPLFAADVPVCVTVWFLLPRPEDDFKSKSRLRKVLTKAARAMLFAPIKPDLDNLLKYTLDACSGVLYKDDRQVVKIEAYKQRDNHDFCHGGTIIQISKFTGPSTLPNNHWA